MLILTLVCSFAFLAACTPAHDDYDTLCKQKVEFSKEICRHIERGIEFDAAQGECVEVSQGACWSESPFASFEQCERVCIEYPVLPDACHQTASFEGDCKLTIRTYEYSPETGKCYEIRGGGCSATRPFASLFECQSTCEGNDVEPNLCERDVFIQGDCRELQIGYEFNWINDRCKPVERAGCSVESPFVSLDDCYDHCNGESAKWHNSYIHNGWTKLLPSSCTTFFDGCNRCTRNEDGLSAACTERACQEYQRPYCIAE